VPRTLVNETRKVLVVSKQGDQPHGRTQVAVSMNFGPLVLTNIGPPSGV
jgi:hypothetical protein